MKLEADITWLLAIKTLQKTAQLHARMKYIHTKQTRSIVTVND